MTELFKVVQQGEAFAVQSQKAEGGQTMKSNIVLQKFGGRYADQFVAVMLGNMATAQFHPGDIVAASLRFSVHEHPAGNNQVQIFQDILVTEIHRLRL